MLPVVSTLHFSFMTYVFQDMLLSFNCLKSCINKNKKLFELKDILGKKARRKPWEKQGKEKTPGKTR
jgi:hypothetical protein